MAHDARMLPGLASPTLPHPHCCVGQLDRPLTAVRCRLVPDPFEYYLACLLLDFVSIASWPLLLGVFITAYGVLNPPISSRYEVQYREFSALSFQRPSVHYLLLITLSHPIASYQLLSHPVPPRPCQPTQKAVKRYYTKW
jgi:hypothetical protein